MNKIISNFYLIRLDEEPVYVGYTNRAINTRFKEHLRDKDFGDAKVTVEKLTDLSYDFTWDISLINSYAGEVSDKENELILEYGTKDTVWQKGTSGNLGGQTWNNVKNFVKTNQDNPTLRDMKESDIMVLLDWQQKSSKKLQHMVNHTDIKGAVKLQNMVNNTDIKGAKKLKDMANHTDIKGAQKLKSMVNHTDIKEAKKLKSMVNNTDIKGAQKLKDMVKGTKVKGAQKLRDMINHTDINGAQKLKNMVTHTSINGAVKIRNMINHTKAKY